MIENVIAVIASFIIAGAMVYVVDKKWGGPNDSYKG
jgi:hypothetical protein